VQATGDGRWFYRDDIASAASGGLFPILYTSTVHVTPRDVGRSELPPEVRLGEIAFDSTRRTDCGREADLRLRFERWTTLLNGSRVGVLNWPWPAPTGHPYIYIYIGLGQQRLLSRTLNFADSRVRVRS